MRQDQSAAKPDLSTPATPQSTMTGFRSGSAATTKEIEGQDLAAGRAPAPQSVGDPTPPTTGHPPKHVKTDPSVRGNGVDRAA